MVSRKAKTFQHAAEIFGGEDTLRLVLLKLDQSPISRVGSFRDEASGFAFERADWFHAAQARVAVRMWPSHHGLRNTRT